MNKKEEILNEMLNKGYIDKKEHQEKLLDESFSDMDAATYQHIAEAYADESYISFEEFERRMNNAVYNKHS